MYRLMWAELTNNFHTKDITFLGSPPSNWNGNSKEDVTPQIS